MTTGSPPTTNKTAIALVLALAVLWSGMEAVRGWQSWSADPGFLVNLHVRQADAWLHGRLDLAASGYDVARYNGRIYSPFPVGPALLFLPFVAALGTVTWIAPVLCVGLSILACWALVGLLRSLGVASSHRVWLAAAFFFGTGFWYYVLNSVGVWYSSLVVAVTFVLWALYESASGGRAALIGTLLGVAIISRPFTVVALPVAALLVWSREEKPQQKVAWLIAVGAPVALLLGLQALLNTWRFGSVWEFGYSFIPLDGYELERARAYGRFSPAYVPMNLFYLLVQGFSVTFDSADRLSHGVVNPFGTSLTAASPFLYPIFLAPRRHKAAVAAVAGALLAALGQSFYYVNGNVQINSQRYALDFLPLLWIPLALTLEHERSNARLAFWKALVVYSIVLNVFALALLGPFSRLMDAWLTLFAR